MRKIPAPLLGALRLIVLALLLIEPLRWGWDRLTASEIRLSLHDAGRRRSVEGGLGQDIQTVGGEGRVAIFAHPPSRLEWPLRLRRGEHHFRTEVALAEEAREGSDGMLFSVQLVQEGREATIASYSVEPSSVAGDRAWIPLEGSFESAGGSLVLALETSSGPLGHSDFDWGWWAEPRIEEGWRSLSIGSLAILAILLWLLSRELGSWAVPKRLLGPPLFVLATLAVVEILFRSAPEVFPPDAHGHLARGGFCEVGDRHPLRIPDSELGYREPGGRCDRYRMRSDAILEEDLSPAFGDPSDGSVQVCLDEDGFRNPRDLGAVDFVVAGDSFVQGAWIDYPEIWTTRLAEESGKTGLNLGVSGYSPRQSLTNLVRHGLPRRPDSILFALYAGNDLTDEEQFAEFERSAMSWSRFMLAIEEVRDVSTVARGHSHSFALAGLSYLGESLLESMGRRLSIVEKDFVAGFNPVCTRLSGGTSTCFAFTARELLRETLSEQEWRERTGAQLLRQVLLDLRAEGVSSGADLHVVLIPSKATIYLPYLIEDIDERALASFLEEVAIGRPTQSSWLEQLERNTGSAYQVMLELIEESGLQVIELQPSFSEAAARGEVLFYPFDSHWNEDGNRLVARVTAGRLGW